MSERGDVGTSTTATVHPVYFIEVDDEDGRMICSGYRMVRHWFDPKPDDPERCRACGNLNPLITDPARQPRATEGRE